MRRSTGQIGAGRGFSIVELLVAILIFATLAALLVVVGGRALRSAREVAARQTVVGIKNAIEQFKTDHGFLPPLVADERPTGVNFAAPAPGRFPSYTPPVLPGQSTMPRMAVFNFSLADGASPGNSQRDYLRGWVSGARLDADDENATRPDRRFSTYSLGVYLGGLGEVVYTRNGERDVMDGVDGPGSLEPRDDGSFAEASGRGRKGKTFAARFVEGGGFKLVDQDRIESRDSTGRVEIVDRNGVAIRYYRWLRGDRQGGSAEVIARNGSIDLDLLNVPKVVGDAATNAELRSADYAVVAAGPNGLFGDMPLEWAGVGQAGQDEFCRKAGVVIGSPAALARAKAREDNVVEVGKR